MKYTKKFNILPKKVPIIFVLHMINYNCLVSTAISAKMECAETSVRCAQRGPFIRPPQKRQKKFTIYMQKTKSFPRDI